MSVKKFFLWLDTASLAPFVTVAALLLAFFWLASWGGMPNADRLIANLMRHPVDASQPWGGPVVVSMMRDISALGSVVVLSLLSGGAVAYLWLSGQWREAGWFAAMTCAAGLTSHGLKYLYAKPRPDLYASEVEVFTYSFPSAHAMMSAVVYLGIGVMVARAQPDQKTKMFIMSLMIGIIVLIGFSRVYLSVHWSSDVLAGWLAGALCVLCFRFAEKIFNKTSVS